MLSLQYSFSPPKIFTNAILQPHDITALIRDTEAHERALFTVASPEQLSGVPDAHLPRRRTNLGSSGRVLGRSQNAGSTAATILGGELGDQIRKETSREGKDRGEVDVNLLLRGAEKLCTIYPIAGGHERITSLRSRFEQLNASISRYEDRVTQQSAQLTRLNKQKSGDDDEDLGEDAPEAEDAASETQVTAEDIKQETEEIEELEKKKRVLEERVKGMERDLGGLLR